MDNCCLQEDGNTGSASHPLPYLLLPCAGQNTVDWGKQLILLPRFLHKGAVHQLPRDRLRCCGATQANSYRLLLRLDGQPRGKETSSAGIHAGCYRWKQGAEQQRVSCPTASVRTHTYTTCQAFSLPPVAKNSMNILSYYYNCDLIVVPQFMTLQMDCLTSCGTNNSTVM